MRRDGQPPCFREFGVGMSGSLTRSRPPIDGAGIDALAAEGRPDAVAALLPVHGASSFEALPIVVDDHEVTSGER